MSDDLKVLISAAGLKKLEAELKELQTTRRKEVSERLAEAISYGDLSENSEYDEAKNEQAFLEARIVELEQQIKHAEVIEDKINDGSVQIGSKVTLQRDGGEKTEYEIVGATEADPLSHKISNESPVGQAILGQKEKASVTIMAPGGEFTYKILKVA